MKKDASCRKKVPRFLMKKFFVSVGLAAAGTASLHADYAPDLNSMQTTKIWSASATLRGFYDSNYATAPDGSSKRGSYGFEFSPSVGLNKSLQQTEIGIRYTYGLYYYQDREHLGENPIDQTHQLDLWIDHAFTEQWQGKVADTFVVGQEPELLQGGTPLRANGNNIANNATLTLNTDWTRLFSTVLTYNNGFYDYQDDNGTAANPSLAGELNRVDQSIALDLQWHIAPETTAFVGYQFEQVNYIGNEIIAQNPPPPDPTPTTVYHSNSRDNRSDFGYVGIQHNLLANLAVAARVGLQYNEDYNDPLGSTSSLAPYAVASATYTYAPGSYAQIGITHQQNATDVVAPNTTTGRITQSQESSVVYGSINHEITAKLLGTLIGSVQYSTYNGGAFANEADVDYSLGLNFNYAFTPHFSTEAGYNYDDLASNIAGRGYTRNRVYVGVTAAF
jgi:hypothetical protein